MKINGRDEKLLRVSTRFNHLFEVDEIFNNQTGILIDKWERHLIMKIINMKPTIPRRMTGKTMMIIEIDDKFETAEKPFAEEKNKKTNNIPRMRIPLKRGIQIVQNGLTFLNLSFCMIVF